MVQLVVEKVSSVVEVLGMIRVVVVLSVVLSQVVDVVELVVVSVVEIVLVSVSVSIDVDVNVASVEMMLDDIFQFVFVTVNFKKQ